MRIRQIKWEWWFDKTLRRGLTAAQREVYIGLWMIADDAGWLRWDTARIAAELFPYDDVDEREALVEESKDLLTTLQPKSPHLIIHDCGCAEVPHLPEHQRLSGTPTKTAMLRHYRLHEGREESRLVAESASKERNVTERNVTERIGKVRNVTRATASLGGPARGEFKAKVRAAGYKEGGDK